ncbi:MAG: hypothetical protein ACE5DY_06690, partial [Mariprofundaceae bacterium]
MKTLLISTAAFTLLVGTAIVLALIFLFDMPPGEIISTLQSEGKFFLYKHELVETLSAAEKQQLYQTNCTRKCHSKDLIENRLRSATEWEAIVSRMKAPDRADLTGREAKIVTRYLQNHFLSNIPTALSEKTMKFVKRHLWKSDFGESDLYLDVIYIPHAHIGLLPFLVAGRKHLENNKGAFFVVFLNTHQGTIPPWNLAEMATINHSGGKSAKAIGWEMLYEDGQHH